MICKIEKPENMPVNARGVRADVIMDGNSTIDRTNIGRLYEHYFGSVCLEIEMSFKREVGPLTLEQFKAKFPDRYAFFVNETMSLYEIASPRQYEFYSKLSEEKIEDVMRTILKDRLYLFVPTDNPVETPTIVKRLEARFKPTLGPVSYIGNSGERHFTKERVRIAPMYFLVLEKIADDWSAVSSATMQHFGILSPITRSEKYGRPWKNSPVKTVGETEGRIIASYCHPKAIPEIMDRNNNPVTHKMVVTSILNADKPGHIQSAVDRSKQDYGLSKSLQIFDHIAACAGWRTVETSE